MGVLEQKSKRGTRKHLLQKVILGTISTVGILGVTAVAPNALQALGMLMRPNGKKSRHFYTVENSRKRMVKNGLLEYTEKGFLKLTAKGEAKLRQLELHDYKLKKPKKWDKKWRILSFDVKEERKVLRDKIRRTLVSIGFVKMHKSVWVYPYDCEDLITLLKADFKIGKDVLYIIADKVENDKWLKDSFGLR